LNENWKLFPELKWHFIAQPTV